MYVYTHTQNVLLFCWRLSSRSNLYLIVVGCWQLLLRLLIMCLCFSSYKYCNRVLVCGIMLHDLSVVGDIAMCFVYHEHWFLLFIDILLIQCRSLVCPMSFLRLTCLDFCLKVLSESGSCRLTPDENVVSFKCIWVKMIFVLVKIN